MTKFFLPAMILQFALLQIVLPTQMTSAQEAEAASMFEGDISDFTAELPKFLTIKVRRDSEVMGNDGASETQTFYEQQTVNPHSEKLSPEQRLGIFVTVIEDQIQQNLSALKDAEDADAKKEIMDELKQQFTDRYSFDTAYQDFKTKEVEEKATGLRKEVDARKQAAGKWVDAMVTLVQARADGIEMMDLSVGTRPGTQQSQLTKADESDISSASDAGATVDDAPSSNAVNQ